MVKVLTGILLSLLVSNAATANTNQVLTLSEKNVLLLNDVIEPGSVSKLASAAKEMDAALPSGDPIILVLDSPGGSIEDGLRLIEVLRSLNRKVNTLSIFSASMGFHTVQDLGMRYVTEHGTLMTHKPRGGFQGEFPGQLDSRYSYYLKRINRMNAHVVERTKGKHTQKSYNALHENEFWCEGDDCLKEGFVDAVVTARCDKTLSGTRDDVREIFFMGIPITITLVMDKCPLITDPLAIKVRIDGKDPFAKKDEKSLYYDTISLNKEELKLLQERVDALVREKTNRHNVIKGY